MLLKKIAYTIYEPFFQDVDQPIHELIHALVVQYTPHPNSVRRQIFRNMWLKPRGQKISLIHKYYGVFVDVRCNILGYMWRGRRFMD